MAPGISCARDDPVLQPVAEAPTSNLHRTSGLRIDRPRRRLFQNEQAGTEEAHGAMHLVLYIDLDLDGVWIVSGREESVLG